MCLAAVGYAFFGPLGRPKPFKQAGFDRVVMQIQRGALRPDGSGVVPLPKDLASLSATGKAYVRQWPSGRLIVFVPSWVGRDTLLVGPADVSGDNWLEGYVYDSRPWSLERAGDNADEDHGEVLAPPAEPPWRAAHDGRARLRLLSHRAKITEHWCSADIFS
jgi:hypothetical protein